MVSLTIGESVISIGELTFSGCSGLSSITINATEPPTVNANSFNGVDKSIPVYIPCGVVTAYQTANVWNEFTNYQEVGCPEVTQITELSEGWNWFSTYITFDDPVEALQALEASLGNNAEQIQSYYYTAEYDGEEWFGDLNAKGIVNQQMYLIYAVNDCTVELTGIPAVVDEYEIVIKPGWNWIGFPNGEAISVEDAMSDFEAEEEDQIQSIDYIAEFDGDEWFGDLGTFVPGQGYMYLSKSDTVKYLVFKTGTKKRRGK